MEILKESWNQLAPRAKTIVVAVAGLIVTIFTFWAAVYTVWPVVKRAILRIRLLYTKNVLLNEGDAERAREMTTRLLRKNPEDSQAAEIESIRGETFIEDKIYQSALKYNLPRVDSLLYRGIAYDGR